MYYNVSVKVSDSGLVDLDQMIESSSSDTSLSSSKLSWDLNRISEVGSPIETDGNQTVNNSAQKKAK